MSDASPGAGETQAAGRGLLWKYVSSLIGLVGLVLVINAAVNAWLTYSQTREVAGRLQDEKADAAAQRIGEFIAEIERQIGWTTHVQWDLGTVEQRRLDYIRLMRQAPAISELVQIDRNGKEQLKVSRLSVDVVGSGQDYSTDPRFAEAIRDRIRFSPVYFRKESEPFITLSVARGGRNPGVTLAEVNLKLIWDVITTIRVGKEGYAYVVDNMGRLIAHPDISLVLRNTDMKALPQIAHALSRQGQSSAPGSQRVVTGRDMGGRAVIAADASIPRLNWSVLVEVPESEALATIWSALYQNLLLLIAGLALAVLAAYGLARRMVAPIEALSAGALRLGGGDFSHRIEPAANAGREIAALAGNFNRMGEQLRESYAGLEAKVEARTRELAEALAHQTSTGNILQVIAASPTDIKPVLEAVAKSACEVCDAYDGAVALRVGDDLVFRAHHGPIPIGLDKWPVNPRWTAGLAVMERKPVHVPDLMAPEAEEFSDGRALSIKMGHRAIVSVPLMREGEAIGAIVLRRKEPHPFSDKQIALLQTFADQAIIAINNVRLFEEVQARTRDLEEALHQQTATAEVLKVISRSAFDLGAVFHTLLESAARLCNASICILYRRDGDVLRVAASHGGNPDFVRYLTENPNAIHAGSISGRAALLRRTVHVPDIEADAEYATKMSVMLGGWRSIIGVPLMRDGEPMGVLALARPFSGPFAQREIELVETFADQAVIAIENARLFEEVQARTRDLEESLAFQTATSDVLNVISRSPSEVAPVLEVIVQTAARLCEAEFAFIARPRDRFMHLAAGNDMSLEHLTWFRNNPIPINQETLTGQAALERRTIHAPDILDDPKFKRLDWQKVGRQRTVLCVPLLREGDLLGVITLARTQVRPFTPRQIELVTTFADQAVIAIENSRLFEEVQRRTGELTKSLNELRTAQDRLVQTEKLASLGQLTAGIAHEIKNPLNFVNNFAALSTEIIVEMKQALAPEALRKETREEVDDLLSILTGNLEKVVQHGKRADSIVKNMLLHSRSGSGERRLVDVNALAEESLNLAFHGARAEKSGFNVSLSRDLDPKAGAADLYPQEITRVLLNLITNGFYAVSKRKSETGDEAYDPSLSISTRDLGDRVEIRIRDNGTGIPDDVKARIFDPFFTTKPAGEGTGLGLSLSHDIIVKQHGGSIDIATQPGEFTEFRIVMPRRAPADQQASAS